jgi:hypothetical protein
MMMIFMHILEYIYDFEHNVIRKFCTQFFWIINFKAHICIDPNFMVHTCIDQIYYVTDLVQHNLSAVQALSFFFSALLMNIHLESTV